MQLDAAAALADENARLHAQLQAQRRGLSNEPRSKPLDPAVFIERCQVHGDDSGREFRENTAKALEELSNALTAMRRNPTQNAAQIEIAAATMVRKRAEDREVLFDVRRKSLLQQQTEVESQVEAALQPPRPVWAALAPELRSLLRSLPEQQRYDLVNNARDTEDFLLILHAVASAPAALSGLAPGKVLEVRNMVLGIRNPVLLSRPQQLAKELALLNKCREGFRRTIAELVDFDKADALKQLAGDAT